MLFFFGELIMLFFFGELVMLFFFFLKYEGSYDIICWLINKIDYEILKIIY